MFFLYSQSSFINFCVETIAITVIRKLHTHAIVAKLIVSSLLLKYYYQNNILKEKYM